MKKQVSKCFKKKGCQEDLNGFCYECGKNMLEDKEIHEMTPEEVEKCDVGIIEDWEETFDKLFNNGYHAFDVYRKNIKEFIKKLLLEKDKEIERLKNLFKKEERVVKDTMDMCKECERYSDEQYDNLKIQHKEAMKKKNKEILLFSEIALNDIQSAGRTDCGMEWYNRRFSFWKRQIKKLT